MGTTLSPANILEQLQREYGDKISAAHPPGGADPIAVIDREHVLPVLQYLRDDSRLSFDLLTDVTVVDHLHMHQDEIGSRFAVVYQLQSLAHNHRFRVKARVPEDDPRCPSVYDLWRSALWGEREAHDMFGVEFDGNPDMRRLLMPEDYPGFPLRKDYPLRGRGERDSFPQYRPGKKE